LAVSALDDHLTDLDCALLLLSDRRRLTDMASESDDPQGAEVAQGSSCGFTLSLVCWIMAMTSARPLLCVAMTLHLLLAAELVRAQTLKTPSRRLPVGVTRAVHLGREDCDLKLKRILHRLIELLILFAPPVHRLWVEPC
jgi:hypothetical protein